MEIAKKIKRIETIIHARPAPDMSLKDLALKLKELGNQVIDIDYENGTVLIAHTIQER